MYDVMVTLTRYSINLPMLVSGPGRRFHRLHMILPKTRLTQIMDRRLTEKIAIF